MRASLRDLLATDRILLADGATGTNYFRRGLQSGEPPEFWNFQHPERVYSLHRRFVDSGSDLILTNTFGCNRNRLKLHRAEDQVFDIAKRAASIAAEVVDECERPVVVAGSVGPTGELFEPLGALTHAEAVAAFREQMEGLAAGGVDLAWIETMSSAEEIRAAAMAAIQVGLPYVVTCSFDTAGRTMMGLLPQDLGSLFAELDEQPLAIGGNCGVGAPDLMASILAMGDREPERALVAKANCGVPRFQGTEIEYSGTPELMAIYAQLAADAGVRIVGGCCGTSPEHLAAMRVALDEWVPCERPTVHDIVARIGPLTNALPGTEPSRRRERTRDRRAAT